MELYAKLKSETFPDDFEQYVFKCVKKDLKN